jgi:hypothetical protein
VSSSVVAFSVFNRRRELNTLAVQRLGVAEEEWGLEEVELAFSRWWDACRFLLQVMIVIAVVVAGGLVGEVQAQTNLGVMHHVVETGGGGGRRLTLIPSGALSPVYTLEMRDVDLRLARLFGGDGAVAAGSGFDLEGLPDNYAWFRGDFVGENGMLYSGHLSSALHLYGSKDGRGDTAVYVPAGFKRVSSEPGPDDGAVVFYYDRLGSIGPVTLVVFHVRDFELKREGGRVRIGVTGGVGGEALTYRHVHIEAYYGDVGVPSVKLRAQVQLKVKPSMLLRGLYADSSYQARRF